MSKHKDKGKRENRRDEQAKPASLDGFPWERMPDESIQAYSRFVTYRNTPASERSIRKLGVSMQLAARWSKRHSWVRRTTEYDAWLVGLSDDLAQHAVLSSRRQLVRFGSASISKASAALVKLDETKLGVDDITSLVKVGASSLDQALGVRPPGKVDAAPANFSLTSVQFGVGLPGWAAGSNASQIKQNETVVECGEKVLAELNAAGRAGSGSPQEVALPNRQLTRLKERLVTAPVRNPDE